MVSIVILRRESCWLFPGKVKRSFFIPEHVVRPLAGASERPRVVDFPDHMFNDLYLHEAPPSTRAQVQSDRGTSPVVEQRERPDVLPANLTALKLNIHPSVFLLFSLHETSPHRL